MHRGARFKLIAAASAQYAKPLEIAEGFTAEDYETDDVEVWPENWPAFRLFCTVQTQWRHASGGTGAAATGLDYAALLAVMARMKLADEDHDALFDDVQVLERAALEAMNAKD